MIRKVNSWAYSYKPSAAEECKQLMHYLGIDYCNINSVRGSHSADIWIGKDSEELFKNEILGNTFVNNYRAFHFGKTHDISGIETYHVSYLNKRNYL